jgi:hypothetical protein
MSEQKNVRFIRKNGKVIPIKDNGAPKQGGNKRNDKSDKMARAKRSQETGKSTFRAGVGVAGAKFTMAIASGALLANASHGLKEAQRLKKSGMDKKNPEAFKKLGEKTLKSRKHGVALAKGLAGTKGLSSGLMMAGAAMWGSGKLTERRLNKKNR